MSARQELAERIADFIRSNDLSAVHGGDVGKTMGTYAVGFSKPRTLDGEVRVYGEKFIRVQWQTAYRALAHKAYRVFESEKDVLDFLRLAFCELKFDEAMDIPTKGTK